MAEPGENLPQARYEERDLPEAFIWAAVGLMLVLLLVSALLIVRLYPQSRVDRRLTLPLAEYPTPRLQISPRDDMRQFRADQLRRLNGEGAGSGLPPGGGRLPIAQAMRQIAAEGIPDWPAADSTP